jgi:hypothetical protein
MPLAQEKAFNTTWDDSNTNDGDELGNQPSHQFRRNSQQRSVKRAYRKRDSVRDRMW